jgi:peptidoglycan/LPS O-acetylase OafA/YrhL
MRGIAALTIALMHVSVAFAYFPFAERPGRNFLDRAGLFVIHALSNGYGAVVAFFVISGFVLARSLDRKFDIPRFVIARVFRLYPAVIVTIAIFAAIYYAFGFSFYPKASFEPLNVLANMLILRRYRCRHVVVEGGSGGYSPHHSLRLAVPAIWGVDSDRDRRRAVWARLRWTIHQVARR